MFWLAIALVAAGLVTYLQRVSLIVLWQRLQLPAGMRRALRYVPIAVLTGLIVPELFVVDGVLQVSAANERLLAGVAAALVAWRTSSVFLTIVAGMAVLLLLMGV